MTRLGWESADLKRDDHYLSVVGRLRPGVSAEQAQQEMRRIARRLAEAYPAANDGYGALVKPVSDVFPTQKDRRIVAVLMCIVGFVLLIACANIVNLQLAKANGRSLETATRSALGASRFDLIRQHLLESWSSRCSVVRSPWR